MFCNLRGMAKKRKRENICVLNVLDPLKNLHVLMSFLRFQEELSIYHIVICMVGEFEKKTERKKKELGVRELESMRLRKP